MQKILVVMFMMFSIPAMAYLDLKARVTSHMSSPAAIAYSPQENCYYITNITGNPNVESNNGFVTRLSIDEEGRTLTEVVIKGGEKGIVLNAPKGIVYNQGYLYITDITKLRIFSIDYAGNWKAIHNISVPNSQFLNEIVLDRKGIIWAADSVGDCIFELRPPYQEKVRRRYFYRQIVEPMGIALSSSSEQIWLSSLSSDLIYKADLKTRKITNKYHFRIRGLAGICAFDKNKIAAVDFSTKAYIITIDGNKVVRETINREPLMKPSGIIYEPVSGLVLVTELKDNAVSIFMKTAPIEEDIKLILK